MKRKLALRGTLLVGTALTALTLAAGCGNDGMGGMNHGGTAQPSASVPAGASFNDTDVKFTQMMIPHHEQAVQMATLAETKAADPELKTLAAQIKSAQAPEIATMQGWLKAWGQPTTQPGGHNMPGMPGLMTDEQMNQLKAAQGAAFDRLFTQMMIAHHEGAITMAREEQAKGADSAAKALAATIEKSQSAEVEQLKKILARL
jgi:uncharacterized protein (DUF305 family)